MVLTFSLALFFFMTNSMRAAAAEENIPTEYDELYNTSDVSIATSHYIAIRNYLINRGRQIFSQRATGSYMLSNINRLAQMDSRWKDVQICPSGGTIGNSGCALTSFTMARNYLSDANDTPATVAGALGSFACPFNWKEAPKLYGYTTIVGESNDNGIDSDTAISLIAGTIDVYDIPVIVGFIKSNGDTHFVLAYGYMSSGDIYIKDPASQNYGSLSRYLDEGCSIHRIYAYSK